MSEKQSKTIKKLWEKPEYREHMRKVHKGQKPWNTGKKRPEMTGENHFAWKGNEVGYHALHTWVERRLGKPQCCDLCGTIEKRRYHWANKSGKYKRKITDWIRLCVPCHGIYDKRRRLK